MCPPGVDQTMRSPQMWHFLAPEMKQAFQPAPGQSDIGLRAWHSFSMSDMLFDSKQRFDAWSLLARPVAPRRSSQTKSGSLGSFDILSNELVDMVIENLSEKSDIIALGLTCEGFWQMISRHIQKSYIKAAAPWARTKIAFQGSYCYDLPKPFLEGGLLESIVPEDWDDGSWGVFREFYWECAQSRKPVCAHDEALAWLEAAEVHQKDSGILLGRWNQIKKDMECGDLFPKDRSWVLRNLTTHETVSSEMIKSSRLRSWSWKDRTQREFEDVLMMKICWTTYPSYGDEQFNLHRGVWAGHRFDIVTSEIHSQEEDPDKWQDITNTVMKELTSLKRKFQR